AADGAPVRAKKHASSFLPLDPFTVNLADEGGERMAQIGVTLEVADSETETALKARMPALRNGILLQLSASQSSELLTLAGKQRLAARIAELAGGHVGWKNDPAAARPRPNPVEAVHFSQFIVQ
ncbi:MAG: flagellar basal body-associated protein FliL, partial [Gammaproteobacteria bacterium]